MDNINPLEEEQLESKKTEIEKIMMGLNHKTTDKERRFYLAGVLDTWFDEQIISEEVRGQLYESYCF